MSEEKKDSLWSQYSDAEKQELEALNKGYREFLTTCKTERESVKEAVKQAEAAGYRPLKECVKKGESLKTGDKVYADYNGKCLVLYHIGEESIEKGMNILEVKVSSSLPMWLIRFLRENDIDKTSFSKYGMYYKEYLTVNSDSMKRRLRYA